MNKRQKIALWVGVGTFLIITVFPWNSYFDEARGISKSKVILRWIQPPQLYKYWVVVGVVTGALIISLKESKSEEEK